MRQLVKYISNRTYRPLLVKYLSKTRTCSIKGIRLEIPPGVFHPRFFFSSRLLLKYISDLPLHGKKVLDLGSGSGLLGIYAAKQGAEVTAIDISSAAVHTIKKNAILNNVYLQVLQSDMFAAIEKDVFDYIIINPPYYKKQPVREHDYAWFCGEDGEYFEKLFSALWQHIHAKSTTLMILCDGCDLGMIRQMAACHGYALNCVYTKKNLVETNYIFSIERQ